jgi:drug/metabolite transporter (DMT)-like permease
VALCGGILPPLFFSISAPHLPRGFATVLGSIELPVAVIMARMGSGESVTLMQWLGILLILIGISISEVTEFMHRAVLKKKTAP